MVTSQGDHLACSNSHQQGQFWGHVVNFTPTPHSYCRRPHLGRGGAAHDAGEHSDHVHCNGICVLVQHLGVGRGSEKRQEPGRHTWHHPAIKGTEGQGQMPRGGCLSWPRALGGSNPVSAPAPLFLARTPVSLILTVGPSLSGVARPTVTKRPAKEPRLGGTMLGQINSGCSRCISLPPTV